MRIKEMQWLGDLACGAEESASAPEDFEEGRGDGVNEPEHFDGRNGYDPGFLRRFSVPLPLNEAARDEVQRDDGEGSVLTYTNFSVVMSKSRRLAVYVACNIDGSRSARTQRRGNRWFYDARIPLEYQIGNEAYLANELDRGHLVRREDPIWGPDAAQANADSFHYTNCAPQHAALNQHIWLGLENYILENAREHDLRVTVFTGPVFRGSDRKYRDIQVPREYWKVVAVRIGDRPSATAYLLSQERLIRGNLEEAFEYGPYRTYQVSVRRIEKLTGLDFNELSEYDGFSGEEAVGPEQISEIADWEQIRL